MSINENQGDGQPKRLPIASEKELSTYRKHNMDYFTKDGVTLRTGFSNALDWFLLCVRELMDNGIDSLTRYYNGADNTIITVEIIKDDAFFHLKVKNSNYNDFQVFENKKAIFDYEQRYGSKQNLHVINRGMLGDAMKQILAFGHILMHFDNDGSTSFQDRHWNHPLIIRHNKKEYQLYLRVNKSKQIASIEIKKSSNKLRDSSTEIEFTLPIPADIRHNCSGLTRTHIEKFCKRYPLFTTDVSFKFEITDLSSPRPLTSQPPSCNTSQTEIVESILTTINGESPKATIKIEYDALHSISTESWNKQNSVYSYTPEEFKRRIVNIDSLQAAYTTVYDLLQTYREGTNLRKTSEHEISITELLNLPERKCNQKIQSFYRELKAALPFPPEKLVLPYTNKKGERRNALITRLCSIYPNLDKDKTKAAYKMIHGKYTNSVISYPYFFEILAIPFADPRTAKHNIEFIGAVNYSISPKENGNLFEGDYSRYIIDEDPYSSTKDILGVLDALGFHSYPHELAKIPCVIIANLVTPRRDPHGQDKSRIDITPFAGTIVEGVRRLAAHIKTYRAVGIHFSSPKDRFNASFIPSGRGQIKALLEDYLRKEHRV